MWTKTGRSIQRGKQIGGWMAKQSSYQPSQQSLYQSDTNDGLKIFILIAIVVCIIYDMCINYTCIKM